MKINPITQTKVFNQRKPQNSLNGIKNPLLKQQSVQDAFEKQISFGRNIEDKLADKFVPQSECKDLIYVLLKKFLEARSHDGSWAGGSGGSGGFWYQSNIEKYYNVLYLISAGYTDYIGNYMGGCYEASKLPLYNIDNPDSDIRKIMGYFPLGSSCCSKGKDDLIQTLEHSISEFIVDAHHSIPTDNMPEDVVKALARGRKNFVEYCKKVEDFGEIVELRKAYPLFTDIIDKKYRKIVVSHIEGGTLQALKVLYPEESKIINKIAAEYGIGPDGRYMTPELETPVKILDFDSENDKVNQKADKKRNEAIEKANESTEYMTGTGLTRAAKAIGTVGISEIIRYFYYEGKKKANLAAANREIAAEREELDKKYQSQIKKREAQMEKAKRITQIEQKVEKAKEEAKQELQGGLINKINDFYKDIPVDDMPNCVMLVTPNPYIARELAYWTGDVTDTNFVEIPYNQDKNVIQEDLINELEHAEEEYQNTGRRSIIYVENMEDLINPEINEDEMIAEMKDYMQCADEDYHSTVIFTTSDPDKLWYEALSGNRVGLRVEIPVSIEDANINKNESEEQ